ncbi:MAG: hypothetical protein JOY69_07520 [Candidatus Eremiobacteraeota bacterium]|nr:hypothetical protein [Candidatus Eremiobacteraeota bacterium]
MFLNPALTAALDRITERAADVRRAFVPGAIAQHGDVAMARDRFDFTLDPLSVAPPETAYFLTTDAHGRTAYTRDGSFSVRDGTLVDSSGCAVLARRAPGEPLGELKIDPIDASLGRTSNLRLLPDGTLVYSRAAVDPRSGKRQSGDVAVGRLALAHFPAGTKLDSTDGRSFYAPPGITPRVGVAGDKEFGSLTPMQRSRSRIDLDASLIRLKEAYVAFDALAAAESAKDRFSKAAMDVVK